MITLVALVVLLLGLVVLLATVALAYAVHRYPRLTQPILVALTGAGLMVALVTAIINH